MDTEYEQAWSEDDKPEPLSDAVEQARKKAKEEEEKRKREYAEGYASDDTEGGTED